MGWLSCSNKCLRLWCCGTCRLFREDPILYVRAEHLHDLGIRELAALQEGLRHTLDAGPHSGPGQKGYRLSLMRSSSLASGRVSISRSNTSASSP